MVLIAEIAPDARFLTQNVELRTVVMDNDGDVFPVQLREVVAVQIEREARDEPRAVAVSLGHLLEGLLLFQPYPGEPLAALRVAVVAGVVVDLVSVVGLALSLDGEVERGLLEVVCRLHDLAGADAARPGKLADGLLLRDEPPAGNWIQLWLPVDRLVGNGSVGKDKKVLVSGVLEEVEESLLLEEAGDENQVGLAVLNALPPLLVAFREPEFVSIQGDVVVLEDLPDDLDDGFLLEDAAVLVEHREPGGGRPLCLVQIKPSVFPRKA